MLHLADNWNYLAGNWNYLPDNWNYLADNWYYMSQRRLLITKVKKSWVMTEIIR